ncbi:uracil-DNA glycosylase [Candidatus Thiosymbion oneisti]|uniref:uracil-DNA glycosylase n=1 Tax=Candidatus Thiosymbion oneisti TaxID=589554 RepID=UPI000A954B02|nr:uracil-DNA glycosylase [Candidatus Thiosymbion oneisti]
MDPERSRRYLGAMGVQVWRLRAADGDTQGLGQGPEEVPPPVHQGDSMASESAGPSNVEVEPPPEAAPDALPTAGVAGMDWERLSETVAACRACELCETRTQTVFGVGNRRADLMIVGEAPGADEDRQGEPFVGRAGQLLNLMLAAIGFEREQVFIANILKCRPPGNRDPRPEETLRCEPYLMRQIALVRPRVLLSVGRISAQKLLKTGDPIGKLRGRWFAFGPDEIPLTVTYHPAYLLRSPEQKSKAWQDLLKVTRRLRETAGDPGAGVAG